MKRILNMAVLSVCAVFLSGCTSIMVFQDAKTVPQGSLETGVGMAAGSYSSRRTLANFDLTVPSVAGNAWLRYGIISSWDAGVNLAIPGNCTVDTKVMFMNEDNGAPFTMSGGAGYGFSMGNGNTENDSQVQKVTDYIIPLYFSKNMLDWLTAYVSPRYFYRRTYNEQRYTSLPATSEVLFDNMMGVGAGFAFNFNEKSRLMLEWQYTAPFSDLQLSSVQLGIGLATRWGGNKEK
ncbi:MAG: DUF5777 family beta-barrel protein [Elusimicrobiaceae bacterium]|nr:DUF5777 family beta-barrel protein [Elusimicrobiaceae bacterium]